MKTLSKCCNEEMIIKFNEENKLHYFVCGKCLAFPVHYVGVDKNIEVWYN